MKNKLSFLVIILALSLFNCSKDDISNSSLNELETDFIMIENQNFSITKVDLTNQTLKFASDSDDERIRVIKCYLHPIIEELCKDPEFNLQVLEHAKLSKHNTANLSQILSENPNYKDYVDEQLKKISMDSKVKDYIYPSFENLEEGYTYHGKQYIPSIFVPNLENVDPSKMPIISTGVEADSESFPEFEDYIIANVCSEDFSSKEIYLNEEKVLALTTPVFIIDNSIDYELTEKTAKFSLKPIVIDQRSSKGIVENYLNLKTYDHKINVRYESVGNSEFTISGARIVTYTEPDSGLLYLPGVSTWLEINSIDKDEIGDMLYKWVTIGEWFNIEPYDENYLFFNTYERDWAASNKFLGSATLFGVTISLYGKMTYSDDIYAYIPEGGLYEDIDVQYIYENGSRWYGNYLYMLRFYLIHV